jgi:hypothetical protein
MVLPQGLSERLFQLRREEDLREWLVAVDREVGGLSWRPVGGFEDNIHAIEVSADPALALVERVTNAIDALLELRAVERGETADSPRDAAREWWGVPSSGLSELTADERRELGTMINIVLDESEDRDAPTVTVQDAGCGVHPDDFGATLLSLMAGNKKMKHHLMGVYNAGGAATYKFCNFSVLASRRSPALLNGRPDEVGMTIVRYNPLDSDYKTGTYEYCAGRKGDVLRLGVEQLPELPYGTYVRHIRYPLLRYASIAWGPKNSLWHLLNAALFDPPLPMQIRDRRAQQYKEVANQGGEVRRVITGLRHLLGLEGRCRYSEERRLSLGPDDGAVLLRYWVFSDEVDDPDAYVRADQALTLTLNGQRQGTRSRQWVKRELNLHYLFNRVVIQVDCDGLTSGAKRQVFAATRESHAESKLTQRIMDRVCEELREDDELYALDEQRRERALSRATETVSERVKQLLARRIASVLPGQGRDEQAGKGRKKRKRKGGRRPPREYDDSAMLDTPDVLRILTTPVEIDAGHTASMRVHLNGKNGFLPRYRESLKIVVGPSLMEYVRVRSVGSLLGGEIRVVLEADDSAPRSADRLSVALVIEELAVVLSDHAEIRVTEPTPEELEEGRGGQPDVDVTWVGRDRWDELGQWDERTVGAANVTRDAANRSKVVKVDFVLNEAFFALESAVAAKKLGEVALPNFRNAYAYPVCWALFEEDMYRDAGAGPLAMDSSGPEGGEAASVVTEEYQKAGRERLGRAVLMALEPELDLAALSEE